MLARRHAPKTDEPMITNPAEGIVSKQLGSRYRSGRSPDWLKFKNPAAPAVERETEEEGREDSQRMRAFKRRRFGRFCRT